MPKRGSGTSPPGVRSVATVSSSDDSAASTQDRSTRCGAFGHPTENASVNTVSSDEAPISAPTYSGCALDSFAAMNRVPTRTPDAPRAITSATGGDDGYVHIDRREKLVERRPAADVSPGFGPLDDDEVTTGGDRLPCFVRRTDLPCSECATVVHEVDELGGRIAVEELDDLRTRRGGCNRRTIEERHQEVHTERPVAHRVEQLPDRCRTGAAEHPEPAGIAHGARESRVRDPAAHTGELQRFRHTDEVCKGRHARAYILSAPVSVMGAAPTSSAAATSQSGRAFAHTASGLLIPERSIASRAKSTA